MPNMIDFIKENRNKTFDEMPLTNVDNLILSTLSYLDFSQANYKIGMTLRDYYTDTDIKESFRDVYISKISALKIIKYLAYSKRYYNIKVFNYIEKFSSKEVYQFSATTFCLPDGKLYLSFRGTDEKIESWHEDFALSYTCPVMSQYISSKYLEKILKSFDKNIYVGGHSKGGNLAIYSSLMQNPSYQNRILKIFNNDGPGFPEFVLKSKRYSIIKNKIVYLVPQSSIIGMLLDHEKNYKVLKSDKLLLLQHDPLNWNVTKEDFDYTNLSKESIVLDKSINKWLSGLSLNQRKKFVDTIFSFLYKMRDEVSNEDINPAEKLMSFIKVTKEINEEDKKMIENIGKRLIKEVISNMK